MNNNEKRLNLIRQKMYCGWVPIEIPMYSNRILAIKIKDCSIIYTVLSDEVLKWQSDKSHEIYIGGIGNPSLNMNEVEGYKLLKTEIITGTLIPSEDE